MRTWAWAERKSEGHGHLKTQAPSGLVALGERLVGAVEALGRAAVIVVIAQQFVPEPVDIVAGQEIQLGPGQTAGGPQLKFQAFDVELLPPEFGTICEGFRQAHFPIGNELGQGRLIRGTQHVAIVGGQAHQPPQLHFGPVEIAQGRRRLGAVFVILLAGLRFGGDVGLGSSRPSSSR